MWTIVAHNLVIAAQQPLYCDQAWAPLACLPFLFAT